jgi:ATP-dependent exoDNAse (exonuclease V) alpha subunit
MQNIELNDQFQAAIQAINDGQNVFVTGAAGTGKSTLLQHLRSTTSKQCVVLAPTGVAALNVGGQTIHSFFNFKPRYLDPIALKPFTSEFLHNLEVLIIDEVSMVRADVMDAIDIMLRGSRSSDAPFGGVQVVPFGDLYQIPPVVDSDELEAYFKERHGGPYFFQADVFTRFQPKRITLVKNYRQKDADFLDLLWRIRTGETDTQTLSKLNERYIRNISPFDDSHVYLTATNKAACERNNVFLNNIASRKFTYAARIEGSVSSSSFPTESLLELKTGAKVMMVKNDLRGRWVNGTVGRIAMLDDDLIQVDIDGSRYTVEREQWENVRYVYNRRENRVVQDVVGVFEQYPMRLAWAITIHKSQGHTLERVCIDLGRGAFAHGQTYVALSRCTSLDGILLRRPIKASDIILDPRILEYERMFADVA